MIERDLFYYRIFIVIFWIEACFGFVSEELLPIIKHLGSPLFFLADVILVMLTLVTIQRKKDLVIALSFVFMAILSTSFVNHESIIVLINGSRQFIGVICFIPTIHYLLSCDRGAEFKAKIDKHLFIFLCLQAFCITEQFIRYGANDHGGGTFGFGGSGTVSILIIVISFYLVSQRWNPEDYLGSIKSNKKYIFLMYPVMLNETKISFVLLLCYFLLLYKFEIKSIGKFIIALPIIILGMIGLYQGYIVATGQNADDVATTEFVDAYLNGGDVDELVDLALLIQDGDLEVDPSEWWTVDIPRFAKIGLLDKVLNPTKGGLLLGAGVGQFKGGSTLQETKFALDNKWILQGTRPMMFSLVIQLGIIGLIWFLYTFFTNLQLRLNKLQNSLKLKLMLLAVFTLILFYADTFCNLTFCAVFYYFITQLQYYNQKVQENE